MYQESTLCPSLPKGALNQCSPLNRFDKILLAWKPLKQTFVTMTTGVVGYYRLIAFWDQRAFYFFPEFFPNTFIWMVWSSAFSAVYCGFFFKMQQMRHFFGALRAIIKKANML